MNLIKCKIEPVLKEGYTLIKDFRKVDHAKINEFLENMMINCKKLKKDFTYTIESKPEKRNYFSYKGDHLRKINFEWQLGSLTSKFNLKYPELIKNNYFVLNGSTYIPLMFLERAPIDKIEKNEQTKIFINLIPTFNLTFDFKEKVVNIRGKNININIFIFILFGCAGIEEDLEYCDTLIKNGIVLEDFRDLDYEKCIKEFTKILGIEKVESFKDLNITIDEFIDEYILLDYYKEVFYEYFGVTKFKDIVKKAIDYKLLDIKPEMADISNRRVVMTEYLLQPLFELYIRLLFTMMNISSKTVRLPSTNDRSLITSGFNKLMHNGQLFNSSLPYTAPLIHKISQDIVIIKNGVPRNWTSNHDNAFGVLCPISVSAQNMGSNLVFTQDTQINKYGKILSYNEH